jgi:hypothetical protein
MLLYINVLVFCTGLGHMMHSFACLVALYDCVHTHVVSQSILRWSGAASAGALEQNTNARDC